MYKEHFEKNFNKIKVMDKITLHKILQIIQYNLLYIAIGIFFGSFINYLFPDFNKEKSTADIVKEIILQIIVISISLYYLVKMVKLFPYVGLFDKEITTQRNSYMYEKINNTNKTKNLHFGSIIISIVFIATQGSLMRKIEYISNIIKQKINNTHNKIKNQTNNIFSSNNNGEETNIDKKNIDIDNNDGENKGNKNQNIPINNTNSQLDNSGTTMNINNPGMNMNNPGINMNNPGINMNNPGMNMNNPGMNMNNPGMNMNNQNMNMNKQNMNMNNPGMNMNNPGMNMNNPGMNMNNQNMNMNNPGMNMDYDIDNQKIDLKYSDRLLPINTKEDDVKINNFNNENMFNQNNNSQNVTHLQMNNNSFYSQGFQPLENGGNFSFLDNNKDVNITKNLDYSSLLNDVYK